jgi:hypothetical protein
MRDGAVVVVCCGGAGVVGGVAGTAVSWVGRPIEAVCGGDEEVCPV